ncbi:hypothetical protein CLIB1423_01S12288 [[Candida] railenensis]|uniref:Uncharacterized protein n=1 Tax=[Candida] railenensis TaxID=45579 RepID=A0A9P0VWL3_9ASCO|nr:hypothetical protein CLIB1423_01S12288 [[Candida] railenensis]
MGSCLCVITQTLKTGVYDPFLEPGYRWVDCLGRTRSQSRTLQKTHYRAENSDLLTFPAPNYFAPIRLCLFPLLCLFSSPSFHSHSFFFGCFSFFALSSFFTSHAKFSDRKIQILKGSAP